eukprot:9485381-Pyramimonas_sp.AAC.2
MLISSPKEPARPATSAARPSPEARGERQHEGRHGAGEELQEGQVPELVARGLAAGLHVHLRVVQQAQAHLPGPHAGGVGQERVRVDAVGVQRVRELVREPQQRQRRPPLPVVAAPVVARAEHAVAWLRGQQWRRWLFFFGCAVSD